MSWWLIVLLACAALGVGWLGGSAFHLFQELSMNLLAKLVTTVWRPSSIAKAIFSRLQKYYGASMPGRDDLATALQGLTFLYNGETLPTAWPQYDKDWADAWKEIADDTLTSFGVTVNPDGKADLTPAQLSALLAALEARLEELFPPPPTP